MRSRFFEQRWLLVQIREYINEFLAGITNVRVSWVEFFGDEINIKISERDQPIIMAMDTAWEKMRLKDFESLIETIIPELLREIVKTKKFYGAGLKDKVIITRGPDWR